MKPKSFDFDSSLSGRTILIVENEPAELLRYQNFAQKLGLSVFSAQSPEQAAVCIDERAVDYAYCDLHLVSMAGVETPDGLDVIAQLRRAQSQTIIVAMSSDPRRDIGDRAFGAGAHHFARKPFQSIEDFKIALRLAIQRNTLVRGNNQNQKSNDQIVVSDEMKRMLNKLALRPDIQLNLIGETGTGKEEIAKLYHGLRTSQEGPLPFVIVNCAQLNPTLADSELFGHRKGAFTGASENTIGFIGEAHGGILFLDEIHTLSAQIQYKLLRVLNDGSYTRVGDTTLRTSQFQLLTASTKDLDEEALAGRFSMDLKMRIDGYPILLQPLRNRLHDIPSLLRIALDRNQKTLPDAQFRHACDFLSTFYWSGNIRQFMKVINAWILHCDIYDFPLETRYIPINGSMKGQEIPTLSHVLPISSENQDALQLLKNALNQDLDLDLVLGELEKAIILKTVDRHRTLGEASQALKLSRSTFDARRRKHGLA